MTSPVGTAPRAGEPTTLTSRRVKNALFSLLAFAAINLAVCLPLNWYGLARKESRAMQDRADAAAAAPHLGEPSVVSSAPGTHPEVSSAPGIDSYCLTHNETSTGVAMQLVRPADSGEKRILPAAAASSSSCAKDAG